MLFVGTQQVAPHTCVYMCALTPIHISYILWCTHSCCKHACSMLACTYTYSRMHRRIHTHARMLHKRHLSLSLSHSLSLSLSLSRSPLSRVVTLQSRTNSTQNTNSTSIQNTFYTEHILHRTHLQSVHVHAVY